jgi:hypothetical protein
MSPIADRQEAEIRILPYQRQLLFAPIRLKSGRT